MTRAALTLDWGTLFSEGLLYKVPHAAEAIAPAAKLAAAWSAEKATSDIYSGYRRQVLAREGLEASRKLADEFRARFQTLIVLGIGGSALGTKAVYTALESQLAPNTRRRLIVIENLDPVEFEAALSGLDLAQCGIALITKSGGTIETMGGFAVLKERFERAKLDILKHVVAITDPKSGLLRQWANETKIPSLAVPPDVGGRFSVLTPVGMFPLAFAGVDVEALFRGALDQFNGKLIPQSDLARLGVRLTELELGGYAGHVLFPYATRLKEFGAWFVQLWGESLGKIRFNGSRFGALPLTAVGATDQHSFLQMLMEGRDQQVISFVKVVDWGVQDPKMPPLPEAFRSLSYAYGKTFGTILNAEGDATQSAMAAVGRPVYRLALRDLSAEALGAWIAFSMDLVPHVAAAAGLNPFDQPGVEHGKRLLAGLLSPEKSKS